MDDEVSSADGDTTGSSLKPQKPCDGCRQPGIPCRTSQRVKEERTRVTITKKYEHKIDGIDDRLARIEKLLREVNGSQSSPRSNDISTRSYSTPLDDEESQSEQTTVDNFATTGHYRDTLAAKDVLEQTVTSNGSLTQDPQFSSTLRALRTIVSRIDTDGKGMNLSQAIPVAGGAEMPTWKTIEKLLARGKATPPQAWELYVLFIPMDELIVMCERFHRDKHQGSIAQHTIVYAGLFCLVSEIAADETAEQAGKYWNMGLQFVRLAIDTIAQLPLLAPPKCDNIIALLISSILAIDLAKPYLSWQLNVTAIKMCQTLGYHRVAVANKWPQAERERNIFLFWNCYVMDRNLALRLGRAPSIPEYDITSPSPREAKTLTISVTVVHLLEYWVQVARVQGKICERLYSPAALLQTEHERATIAVACRTELGEAYAQRIGLQDVIRPPNVCSPATMLDPILAGDQLMHYSTLALTLQAVASTPKAKTEALQCARDCLQTSINLASIHGRNIYSWIVYIHWVVLHAPMMTPFTAVFKHIIGNARASETADDLRLLQDFIATSEPARPLCRGTDRFVQLCSVFCDAARLYIQLKTTAHKIDGQVDQSSRNTTSSSFNNNAAGRNMSVEEFDQVLADMGLANTFDPQQDIYHNQGGKLGVDDSLQDWYNANSSLYNLLDQDFGNLDDLGFGTPFDTIC
ncbi:hypothetical protein Slin14017_G066810 [Septoria linicola]|nr:hypothetical protein Slin14017_G066810 [Septoria linicola]